MNKCRVLFLMFTFLFFYALVKPSAALACTCADQGSPDYGDVSDKTSWCSCAASCNDTGSLINQSCPQAPQPTSPPAFVCTSGDYGPLSNKTQWCACAAQNNDTGSLINESCPQAPRPTNPPAFICSSSDYGPLSNKTQWCNCAAQNNDTGSLINQSCPQAPHSTAAPTEAPRATSAPTTRPTQPPSATTPPAKSALTVTKIQINGETLDLNGKLKITLPETFKTLNPQSKIDVTYSDNSTKSFYLGFHYIAPPTASLALSPATGTFNKSCNFSLKINVDTGGNQTDGIDAILLYDPSRLSVTSIINGTIYPDYTPQTIDQVNGKVVLSGLSRASDRYSGQGTLATVNFKVSDNAPSGTTQVKFNFDPNNITKTIDSNIVQTGTVNDILSSVTDGSYTIGTDSCTNPTPAATPTTRPALSTPTPTPRPSPTLSPALRIYDLNGDSAINTFDPATFIKDWKNCPPQIDFDHNGICNTRDYSMLKNQL